MIFFALHLLLTAFQPPNAHQRSLFEVFLGLFPSPCFTSVSSLTLSPHFYIRPLIFALAWRLYMERRWTESDLLQLIGHNETLLFHSSFYSALMHANAKKVIDGYWSWGLFLLPLFDFRVSYLSDHPDHIINLWYTLTSVIWLSKNKNPAFSAWQRSAPIIGQLA